MKDSPSRVARLSIGLAFYSFALVGLNVGVNGITLKSLSAHYHIGDAVLGTLFIFSYLSYALASFFCGPLAERLGLRWLLVLGTSLFLVGTLGYILEVPFALLEAFCFCMGMGTGIVETGLNIFLSGLPRRTSLLSYLHAFYGVGTIFGPLLAQFQGIGTLLPYLLVLALILLAFWIYLVRPVSASETAQTAQNELVVKTPDA